MTARSAIATALRHAAARLPDLLVPGRRLVVAYSGGQDSTCLLHALAERGLDVVAVHIDHSLRADSAAAAGRVTEIAASLHVPVRVARVDVPAYRAVAPPGWSVQQAARAARY